LYLRLLSSINIAAVVADVLPLTKAAVVAVVSSVETQALHLPRSKAQYQFQKQGKEQTIKQAQIKLLL